MHLDNILEWWQRIRAGLYETIDKFSDEELSFTLFEGGYSVGETILHIAQEEYGEIQYGLSYKLDEFPDPFLWEKYKSAQSMKELLEEIHGETIQFLASLDDQQLLTEFEAQWGQKALMIDFIVHVIEHEIHHRGELSLTLGVLGRQGLDA